jgi:hypothetical protein
MVDLEGIGFPGPHFFSNKDRMSAAEIPGLSSSIFLIIRPVRPEVRVLRVFGLGGVEGLACSEEGDIVKTIKDV